MVKQKLDPKILSKLKKIYPERKEGSIRARLSQFSSKNGYTLGASAELMAKQKNKTVYGSLSDEDKKCLRNTEIKVIKVNGYGKNGVIRSGRVMIRNKFINFKDKYPEVFYNPLENEINRAYNNPDLPNAVLILSRKLMENLLFNILEKKYPKSRTLWWQESPPRPLDFSVLLNNLVDNKGNFETDEQELIGKFNMLVKPFIKTANQKTHRIMDYLEKRSELKMFKIPEIVQILIKLYNKI